ncbi:MAG: nucleoside deaminase, partial [Firmicutes bacterium]|nr:nucleoside deaminase [Bacillota bacterium]
IDAACKALGGWRLEDCTLDVTLEPCPMCAGAMVQSRISRCVFGAYDAKAGSAVSVLNILQTQQFNHQVEYVGGVLEQECAGMLTEFFRKKRKKSK